MRVLSIVHERGAGAGVFAEAASARGDELLEWVPAGVGICARFLDHATGA
jgi:hypothetical protein